MATNAVQSASSTINLSCASVAVLLGSKEPGTSDDVTTTFHMNLISEFIEKLKNAQQYRARPGPQRAGWGTGN